MPEYTITVSTDRHVDGGMQRLADVVADELDRQGMSHRSYDVTVAGPPELRIGVRYD